MQGPFYPRHTFSRVLVVTASITVVVMVITAVIITLVDPWLDLSKAGVYTSPYHKDNTKYYNNLSTHPHTHTHTHQHTHTHTHKHLTTLCFLN